MLSRVRIPPVSTVAQWVEYTTKWQDPSGLRFDSALRKAFILISGTIYILERWGVSAVQLAFRKVGCKCSLASCLKVGDIADGKEEQQLVKTAFL